MNSSCHFVAKTVNIQISWLLKKPTDLNLHCFQLGLMIVKEFMYQQSKAYAELFVHYLFLILVKFSLGMYIMANFLLYPIRRPVIKSSALECIISLYYQIFILNKVIH